MTGPNANVIDYLCLKQRENLGWCPNDDVWQIGKQDSNSPFQSVSTLPWGWGYKKKKKKNGTAANAPL